MNFIEAIKLLRKNPDKRITTNKLYKWKYVISIYIYDENTCDIYQEFINHEDSRQPFAPCYMDIIDETWRLIK